jgi:hypothetical protein
MADITDVTPKKHKQMYDANTLNNQHISLIPAIQTGVATDHSDRNTDQERKAGEHPKGIPSGADMIEFQDGKICEDGLDGQNEPGPCVGALMRKAHRDRAGQNITWVWTPKGGTIMLNENILVAHVDRAGIAGPAMALVGPVKIVVEDGVIVKVGDGTGQVVGSPAGLGGWLKHRLTEAANQLDPTTLAEAARLGSATCGHDPQKIREFANIVLDSGRTRVISHWEEYAATGRVLLEPVAPMWVARSDDKTLPEDLRDRISRLRSQRADDQLQVRRVTEFVESIDAFSRSNYEAMPRPTSAPRRLIRTSDGEVIQHARIEKYACLSYVWRQWELENILPYVLRLCRNENIQWLWVDQLCIDQNNEVEKSIEVAHMGDYYSGAAITLALVPELQEAPGLDELKRGDRMTIKDAMRLPNVAGTIARAVWSTRVWTFQEGFLSRNLCIVGTVQTVNAQVAVWRGNLGCQKYGFKWAELSGQMTTNDIYTGNGFLKEICVQWDGYARRLSCFGGWQFLDIGDAWRLTSKRRCQDERDRVYGLLGCIKGGPNIRVDYTQGVEILLETIIDANMGEVEILATNSISPDKDRCWAPKSLLDLRTHCFKLRLDEPAIWMRGNKVGVMAQVVDRKVLQEMLGDKMVCWATEQMLIVDTKTPSGVVILSGEVTGEYLWHRERGLDMVISWQQKQHLQWNEWGIGSGRKQGCSLWGSKTHNEGREGV